MNILAMLGNQAKEHIEIQTLNSGGIRDVSISLDIEKNTVISELRKNDEVNQYFAADMPIYEFELK